MKRGEGLDLLRHTGIDVSPGRSARGWFRLASRARRVAVIKGETFRNVVQPTVSVPSPTDRDHWEWV